MIHFIFTENDPRYLFLKFDNREDDENLQGLKKHINLVDPICYLATYQGREPFTQDFLYEYIQPTGQRIYYCAIGLWQEIYIYFRDHNIPFDGLMDHQQFFKRKMQHSFEEFKAIVDSWGMSRIPRPYQYESAYKILTWKQSISELATRAGKTLIAYMVFRYCVEYLGAKRMLMIVPSIDLVTQGFNDFNEYKEFFKTECIWAGGKLVESANLTIGTFQSLIKFLEKKDAKGKPNKKYNPHFFDGYDIVFVDETHRATAEQMKTIISQPFMKNVKIAYGMTGTIPEKNTIPYFCLKSLLGATIQIIKPYKLMEQGYISKVKIKQIRLHYKDKNLEKNAYMKCAEYAIGDFKLEPDPKKPGKMKKIPLENPIHQLKFEKNIPGGVLDTKHLIFGDKREDDLMYNEMRDSYIKALKTLLAESKNSNALVVERYTTHFMDARIDYLCNNVLSICTNNTLILGHHTTYLQYLTDIIIKRFPNRHVVTITGSVNKKRRDEIKTLLKENNDCILIASYGVMSTGITLSNLCFGVLFESFKSNVVNMQSIGRGLGLSDLKEEYTLFDFIDCFDKVCTNKIYQQGLRKIEIYENNHYPYEIINVRV